MTNKSMAEWYPDIYKSITYADAVRQYGNYVDRLVALRRQKLEFSAAVNGLQGESPLPENWDWCTDEGPAGKTLNAFIKSENYTPNNDHLVFWGSVKIAQPKKTKGAAFFFKSRNRLGIDRARVARLTYASSKGIPLTEEHKRRISEALKGRKRTDEQKDRMSAAQKKRYAQAKLKESDHELENGVPRNSSLVS